MQIHKETKNNSNRRQASRIIEKTDLFYHKIKYDPASETKQDFDKIINAAIQAEASSQLDSQLHDSLNPLLPQSYSQENDTLNVNISSSGISFTCKENLVAGDYLMVRVLLLSSMTVILTCCRVVYCRPSNPFENNQYPYTIGAHFVNLKQQDKKLLDHYIKKKRTRRFIFNGLLLSLIMTLLIIPDLILELLLNGLSFLLDNFIEISHITYELFEYSLDHLVEHFFHTEMQQTHLIVFYIQIALAVALFFPLLKLVISSVKKSVNCCGHFYCRKKSSLLYFWGQKSFWYKSGVLISGIFSIVCYLLFFI